MAESLIIDHTSSREEKYQSLLPQLKALVEGESDLVANLSNIMAALKETFGFFWVGVYRVEKEVMVLGPFQGPVACTRIGKGKGVCGTAWKEKRTLVVPDVNAFPGHIACSTASLSEIVVPVFDHSGNVIMVIDVDSDKLNDFSDTDRLYLEQVASLIQSLH
ncbi:MAG: GAF domain-containing protein [Flavobacteriales bacterium]|nr:GAF domain-containing protein [Flavobacteriales bacterium]